MLCRDWLCLLQINFSILKIIFAHLYDFFTSHNTRWSRCTNSLWLNHIKCSHFQLSYPAFLFIFISRFFFFIPHMKKSLFVGSWSCMFNFPIQLVCKMFLSNVHPQFFSLAFNACCLTSPFYNNVKLSSHTG